MIAKGLDFPNVTLVGVINADTALHFPDFRAAERTFQLVTQVAGRTGRGERGGRVLVQTFSPDHPAIVAAMRHDYELFAEGELPARQVLHYPPFASMIRLVVRGPSEPTTGSSAETLAGMLNDALASAAVHVARSRARAGADSQAAWACTDFKSKCTATDAAALRDAVRNARRRSSRPTKCNGSPTSIRWTCCDQFANASPAKPGLTIFGNNRLSIRSLSGPDVAGPLEPVNGFLDPYFLYGQNNMRHAVLICCNRPAGRQQFVVSAPSRFARPSLGTSSAFWRRDACRMGRSRWIGHAGTLPDGRLPGSHLLGVCLLRPARGRRAISRRCCWCTAAAARRLPNGPNCGPSGAMSLWPWTWPATGRMASV